MIELFISDIDGCIAEPYEPYDLDLMRRLVDVIHSGDPDVPAFSLCSGRAYAYVEAMSQVLGLRTPVLFESGGGMFDPKTATVRWNPALTPEVEEDLLRIRAFLMSDCLPGSGMMFDYGKRTQMGIVGPDFQEVQDMVPRVAAFVADQFPDYRVFHTSVSIDVAYKGITKRQAMHWLADESSVDLEAIAYIGDTNGDIPALEIVGHSFAPANATAEVHRVVDHSLDASVLAGVCAALDRCIEWNRRQLQFPRTGS